MYKSIVISPSDVSNKIAISNRFVLITNTRVLNVDCNHNMRMRKIVKTVLSMFLVILDTVNILKSEKIVHKSITEVAIFCFNYRKEYFTYEMRANY